MVTRPNVILILSDDQGYGDLGVYGNPAVQTPHLDALARQGVRLDQHYSGAPLCAPARAALLTGRYHQRTGALSVESNRGMDRIAPCEMTVADLFRAAGYATGMVGKWHNGVFDPRHHPQARGFDEFVGFLNGGMYYWHWILDRGGTPWRSDGRYLTDVFTDEAVNFLRRHRSEPFFLYLAYNAPHAPLEAPPEDVRPFAERGTLSETVSTLYGMVRRMDSGVGRVMEALDALGLAENTVLLFTSDNGPLLGGDYRRYNGPFRGSKNLVLEGGIRVPAMVRWPAGIPDGRVFHGMAHFTDWLPTLLAACGVGEQPELPLDGLNLLPALKGDVGKAICARSCSGSTTATGRCGTAMRRCGTASGSWCGRTCRRRATSPTTTRGGTSGCSRSPTSPWRSSRPCWSVRCRHRTGRSSSIWPTIPVKRWTSPSGIPSGAPAWSGSWRAGSTRWRQTAGASHGDRPSAGA